MNNEADIDLDREAALSRLFEIIRIPSISTDPQYAADCARAAKWHVDDLNAIGFDARLVDMGVDGGHPFVLAHGPKIEGAAHYLFYGHYDVQPVDPLEEWERPPFDPALIERGGKKIIHGRGASDDKGQVMTFIEACRALMAAGGLPLNVTILLEGEEESGSVSLPSFLEHHGDEIRADLALICDTSMADEQTPSISSQLRGLLGEEVIISAANRDLHSGSYGGAAANPAHILMGALASLRDDRGRILIEGFYEGVPELSEAILKDWQKLEHIGKEKLEEVGLKHPAGEEGFGILEKIWARPTMEVNGLTSGYSGEGFKTVLPAKASAKVSFRLVGTQDPLLIRENFRASIRALIPPDCSVEFVDHGAGAASHMDISRPEFQKARAALSGLWPNEAVFVGMGGSIPIVGAFKSALGMDSLLVGFAQDNDQIHAPNEKYDLVSFEKGITAWARILAALAE